MRGAFLLPVYVKRLVHGSFAAVAARCGVLLCIPFFYPPVFPCPLHALCFELLSYAFRVFAQAHSHGVKQLFMYGISLQVIVSARPFNFILQLLPAFYLAGNMIFCDTATPCPPLGFPVKRWVIGQFPDKLTRRAQQREQVFPVRQSVKQSLFCLLG